MRLHYGGRSMEMLSGESVLECMERHGLSVPSSCRSGVCQSCTLRATQGSVPESAQAGLRPALRKQGYFLACQCRPSEEIEVGDDAQLPCFESSILRTERLAPAVTAVWLRRPDGFEFEAGQFVQVSRPEDGLTRPYSVASLPDSEALELHVAKAPQGRMSRWLPEAVGRLVRIRGPVGECTFQGENRSEPLLLAGTGTGLAPLLGVIRTALGSGHEGPLRLFHAARTCEALYGRAVLSELERRHANLDVVYLSQAPNTSGDPRIRTDSLETAIIDGLENPRRLRAYLCGNPSMVRRLRKQLYLAGMALDRIHSDAFIEASPSTLH